MFGPGIGLFFFSVLGSFLPLVLVFLVVVLLRRRQDSDPHERRPYAVYLFSVIFVALATVVGSLAFLGVALAHGITGQPSGLGAIHCATTASAELRSFDDESAGTLRAVPVEPLTEETCAGGDSGPLALASAMFGVVGAAVLVFHVDRARALLAKEAPV